MRIIIININILLLLLIIIIIFLTSYSNSQEDKQFYYNQGSFCNSNLSLLNYFPLLSSNKYLPWIWDAILFTNYIEIIIISLNSCKFNYKQWKELIELYPQYKEQLGYGLDENILINIEQNFDYIRNNYFEKEKGSSLINSVLQCVYLNSIDDIIYETVSYPIKGSYHSDLSSTQIRCPLPPSKFNFKWNRMRLDRYLFEDDKNLINVLSTDSFPICGIYDSSKNQQNNLNNNIVYYDKPSKKYDLAICTATSLSSNFSSSKSSLQLSSIIEWIEYHILIGIQHFYFYDTSNYQFYENHSVNKNKINSKYLKSPLQIALESYIKEGLVTVISWPYLHCVRNMASGRWVGYYTYKLKNETKLFKSQNFSDLSLHSNIETNLHFFSPPRAISHTAALASCYSRYRYSTNWMIHIDVDEYLALSTKNTHLSLLSLILEYQSQYPPLTALSIRPLFVSYCSPTSKNDNNNNDNVHQINNSSIKLRLNSWGNHGHLGPVWESKLIMNTNKVAMFFVHYITELDDYKKEENKIEDILGNNTYDYTKLNTEKRNIFPSIGVVLHYKEIQNSIYGQILHPDNNDDAKYKKKEENNLKQNCQYNGVVNYRNIKQYINLNITNKLIHLIKKRKEKLK